MFRMFTSWVMTLVLASCAVAQTGVLKHEFIYETAPFPECHAATIAETSNGTLLASWFGGTHEKIQMWVFGSALENNAWSKPVEVANGVQNDKLRYPTWNPVLFQMKNGTLALFFKVGPSPMIGGAKLFSPKTMVAPGRIEPSYPTRHWTGQEQADRVGGRNAAVPSSDETGGPWTVHVEITKDSGKTWTKVGPINDGKKIRAIQPTFVVLGGKKLGMLCRDGHADGNVLQAWSEDAGQSWTALEPSSLPNPNSGIDAVTLANGKHLLVYNHTVRSGPVLKVASISAWLSRTMPGNGRLR